MESVNNSNPIMNVTGENGEHIAITEKDLLFLLEYRNTTNKNKKIVNTILKPKIRKLI